MASGPGMSRPVQGRKRPSDHQGAAPVKRLCRSPPPKGPGHVVVAVRVRPSNGREHGTNSRNVVRTVNDQVLVFDPVEGDHHIGSYPRRNNKNLMFAFDKVFDETKDNVFVFENTTKDILDKLLDGCNCSVFAYGATGSGKTFTMLGSEGCPGVVFHTVLELYRRVEAMRDERSCKISVSYFEVYNEVVNDLLQTHTTPLALREDSVRGVVISPLSVHEPSDAQQLIDMLLKGNQNRTQHATDANAESSRSHAVFQVYITQTEHLTGTSSGVRTSKMSFIDLAGSERAATVTNTGARFREGTNINRSLLALGNCINALADHKRRGHVPYRDSKLTRILKDSLGGKCQTVMIAAISPSSLSYEDTYNTLKYADRAKMIKLDAKKNVVSVDLHVSMYGAALEEYKKKNDELTARLRASEEARKDLEERIAVLEEHTSFTLPVAPACATPKKELKVPDHILEDIKKFYVLRKLIVRDLCRCDSDLKCLELKAYLRQMALRSHTALAVDAGKHIEKLETGFKALEAKKQQLEEKRLSLKEKLRENFDCFEDLLRTARTVSVPECLQDEIARHDLELAAEEGQLRQTMLTQACVLLAQRVTQFEQVHSNLLPHARYLHLLAEGHGYMTESLRSTYSDILRTVRGNCVSWADQQEEGGAQSLDIRALLSAPLWHLPSSVATSPTAMIPTEELELCHIADGPGATVALNTTPPLPAVLATPQQDSAHPVTALQRRGSPHPLKLGGSAVGTMPSSTPTFCSPCLTPRQEATSESTSLDQDCPITPDFHFAALRPVNRALEETFVTGPAKSPVAHALNVTFMLSGTPPLPSATGMSRNLNLESRAESGKNPGFVPPHARAIRHRMNAAKENHTPRTFFGRGRPQLRGAPSHQRPWGPLRRSASTSHVDIPQYGAGPRPFGQRWYGSRSQFPRGRGGWYF